MDNTTCFRRLMPIIASARKGIDSIKLYAVNTSETMQFYMRAKENGERLSCVFRPHMSSQEMIDKLNEANKLIRNNDISFSYDISKVFIYLIPFINRYCRSVEKIVLTVDYIDNFIELKILRDDNGAKHWTHTSLEGFSSIEYIKDVIETLKISIGKA